MGLSGDADHGLIEAQPQTNNRDSAVKNRDVFEKNIDTFALENQGVAKVDEALDAQQQQTLRFELETFVCKGHYEEGLRRILEAYVETLRRGSESPAAWVSGFFGSGK